MASTKPLCEIIDLSRVHVLAPVEPTVHEIEERLCREMAFGIGYLPAGTDVLRAFTYPMKDMRVLIVGQDPYLTSGHLMGLNFSVVPGIKSPRSLGNIFHELVSNLGVPRPMSGDLTSWCQQGVILLNRVLIIRPGAPASHKDWGREKVIQWVIETLVERGDPLMIIPWGRPTQSLIPTLGQTPITASSHPSPLSASCGFSGSRPFSRANMILTEMGAASVGWRLP